MPSFIDMLGREVQIPHYPKRIISLVPSQTELLAYLGLENEVVGITLFCIHPEQWYSQKNRIGGTKKLKLDRIRELKPDLIIANKEENNQSDIEALQDEFPVWISDIKDLASAYTMIEEVGHITGKLELEKDTLKLVSKALFRQTLKSCFYLPSHSLLVKSIFRNSKAYFLKHRFIWWMESFFLGMVVDYCILQLILRPFTKV